MLRSASLLKPRTARQKESVIDSHYNIGDRTGAGLLAAAEADGVVFSPWHPTTVADQAGTAPRQADVLAPVRNRHHATMAQLAIAWLLHRSPVMLPIPGTSSPDHFQDNLAGAAISLTGAEVHAITHLIPETPADSPDTRPRPRLVPEAD
jgi:aryl-alcohol dehydrogenase-like predicted oxidoreductase